MKRGIFITIEGPDGSGKSTQIENIKRFFDAKNIPIVFTREPGGTPIGERIRSIILDNNCAEMTDLTEALLYAASRAQHVEEVIKPAIKQGKIVICDRFVDSSLAYQGYGRHLGDKVRIINNYAIDGCIPDITFLLKLDPSVGKHRIREDMQDRLEHEKIDFHQEVFNGYLELERKYSNRIVGIDATRSIEDIRDDIYEKLEELLKGEF